jgi:hypothetical protein
VTATGGRQATLAECFEMPTDNSPWCRSCDVSTNCASNYALGFNTEPNINSGNPFAEQEWCMPVSTTQSLCSVTCDPEAVDHTCPAGWSCQGFFMPCFSDFDCNGLSCIGADSSTTTPQSGRCQCGAGGVESAPCPSANPLLPVAVNYPRCRAIVPGEDMYCLASFTCVPPSVETYADASTNFPAMCLP